MKQIATTKSQDQSVPEQHQLANGPVLLNFADMKLVSGGSPRGTWSEENCATEFDQSPRGTW